MHIVIELDRQRLRLLAEDGALLREYPVSTAARGAGEQRGSYQTPRGRHVIRAKIGAGAPRGAVFVGRRWTGECCTPESWAAKPDRDWILTRILWLTGLDPGFNRGGDHDTLRRYIYIHGCPDEAPLGSPRSHGCIRLRNCDLLDLFERVEAGDRVFIAG